MDKGIIHLSKEEMEFIRYLAHEVDGDRELRMRLDRCIGKLVSVEVAADISGNHLADVRKNHHPDLTAEFLSLFGAPDGLKFLIHDFDPDSSEGIKSIVERTLAIMCSGKYNYRLPKSLYALMNGFIKGPKWYDFDGRIHSLHLNSPVIQEWCAQYPTFHPIISAEFGWEMQCFRNTVRLSKPDFPVRLNSLITNNKPLQSLKIHTTKLDKADFYTNVAYLFQHILKRVLFDIRKRDISAEIMISYDRSVWKQILSTWFRINLDRGEVICMSWQNSVRVTAIGVWRAVLRET